MRYDQRFRYTSRYPDSFPPAVKWLLIVNVALFFVYVLATQFGHGAEVSMFGLVPDFVVHHYLIWQVFTYMFLHDPGGIMHILFNMLALYFFGPDLERSWGSKRFLKFYIVCGVGAAICVILAALKFGGMDSLVIGSSGAIYGVLMAYGLLFPDRSILVMFLFPVKARYFVMIMGALAFYFSLTGRNSGVSNIAHLGGLLVGYIYLKLQYNRFDASYLTRRYQQWKLQRAKKKFQVYMRKHGGPGGTMLQ